MIETVVINPEFKVINDYLRYSLIAHKKIHHYKIDLYREVDLYQVDLSLPQPIGNVSYYIHTYRNTESLVIDEIESDLKKRKNDIFRSHKIPASAKCLVTIVGCIQDLKYYKKNIFNSDTNNIAIICNCCSTAIKENPIVDRWGTGYICSNCIEPE